MATPGYPMGQMGQMPPGPQTGGAQPVPRPIRRGTSKAVPVVVSAGLAVGVFCGLLFGVGTGKAKADVAPSGNNVKVDKTEANAAPAGLGATSTVTTPKPAPPPPPTPATGSGSGAGSGSAVAAATPPPPTVTEPKKITLTVNVKPEAAAAIAKVSVDGTEIQGMTTDLPGDKKSVKVEVKAAGYRTAEKKLDLVGDGMTLEIELSKKPTGPTVRPPKRPDRPPSGGGGLIDI